MMRNSVTLISALTAVFLAAPALADDGAIDVDAMTEQSALKSLERFTPAIGRFNIADIGAGGVGDFMATMPNQFKHGFRLQKPSANFEKDSSAGIASLFVPEEFAFRSNIQDSGVDAVVPGRYLSNSVRSDYLSDTGPAARDKSSVGVRFGF